MIHKSSPLHGTQWSTNSACYMEHKIIHKSSLLFRTQRVVHKSSPLHGTQTVIHKSCLLYGTQNDPQIQSVISNAKSGPQIQPITWYTKWSTNPVLYGTQVIQSHLWTVTVMYKHIFHPWWGYTQMAGHPNSPPSHLSAQCHTLVNPILILSFSHAADTCIPLQEACYLWHMHSYLPYHRM
jgi:hypothetical protein